MNFFDATLVSEEGKLFVDVGDFRVHVPEKLKQPFESYVGKQVTFGIRPEHIHGLPYVPPEIDAAAVTAEVEAVELLGHELHLFLNSGNNSFVSIVDTRMAPTVGSEVDLVINVDMMHLFDPETELAIR
jgi:multiple sugar transport system ATP-binding protein